MLVSKQMQHLEWLKNVYEGDSRAAFQYLFHTGKLDLAEKVLIDGIETVTDTLKRLVKDEYNRMLNKRDEQRCRILIMKSRLLFGVCDPYSKEGQHGKLKEGECFVRITLDGNGKPATIINTEVLVTRNPCLHPGDLQKFKAVDVPEYSHLVDCIVFSTRGKRPSADLMSGGDLDGDKCESKISMIVISIQTRLMFISLRHLGSGHHSQDHLSTSCLSRSQRSGLLWPNHG
jgi:hypothetical protein